MEKNLKLKEVKLEKRETYNPKNEGLQLTIHDQRKRRKD